MSRVTTIVDCPDTPPRKVPLRAARVQRKNPFPDTKSGPKLKAGEIYIDGSCLRQGSKKARAGLGVYFGPNHPLNTSERLPGPVQDNQRAELAACIRALEITRSGPMVRADGRGVECLKRQMCKVKQIIRVYRHPTIYTDCESLVDILTKQLQTWLKTGRGLSGKALAHPDLLYRLSQLVAGRRVRLVHVRAHAGVPGNEMADRLAKAGACEYTRLG
jgi:ribonuclease HI